MKTNHRILNADGTLYEGYSDPLIAHHRIECTVVGVEFYFDNAPGGEDEITILYQVKEPSGGNQEGM